MIQMRAAQQISGIDATNDVSSALHVRGSQSEENHMRLDELNLYAIDHFMDYSAPLILFWFQKWKFSRVFFRRVRWQDGVLFSDDYTYTFESLEWQGRIEFDQHKRFYRKP